MLYLSLKTLHILFVASWFAGLFYAPRIMVNLAEERAGANNAAVIERLSLMMRRLLKFMTVIAVPALVLGLWLWLGFGIQGTWLWIKLLILLVVLGYHHSCFVMLRKFSAGQGRSSRFYRLYNELPVLLMLGMVGLAVFKPMF